ncbi:MAG TPA: glycosyltransferase [Candidatus Saccharimonadales bacterium]|nr:glycosyltransferase [Candidatus Saccharimonadales bacterium]
MRIGLFTDTYRPSINGIVYVVDITRRHLESMGHEVFIFCPGEGVRRDWDESDDDHIIRFRSMKGVFFDDYNLSLFFPAVELRRIKELELDVIQFFTPSQVGLMGVYAAQKTGAILVAQHSTDLSQYIKHYPAVVPGLLMIALTLPMTFRFRGQDIREMMRLYKPRRVVADWGQDIVECVIAMIYSRCDAVIALSLKSRKQLESWRSEYWYDVTTIPTGINALKKPTAAQINKFKAEYGIAKRDEVILYAGRLSAEKNLDILIPMIKKILRDRPNARLLYVGNFEYRETLEQLAHDSGVGDRITFTGALPRENLGVAYASATVFVFPSLTDTQGLVLHEAAHAGLPFVLVDRYVSEVVRDCENGFVARNSPTSLASHVTNLLKNKKLRDQFGERSKQLARSYGEYTQTKKLEQIYQSAMRERDESTRD